MIFFCDNSGAIFKTVPEKIYQGSVNANTIYFVGAFDGDCVVTARFKLPNGLITSEQIMPSAYLALGDNIQTESGEKYGVWSLALKYPVTELSGTVNVQFSVTNANENGVAATVCTASSSFNVEKGVPILQDNSAKNYETLLTQIKAVLTALQNGDTENSIASAESAAAALASEQAAKVSEQAASASAEAAKTSEDNALASEQAAKTSEENAYSVAQSIVVDRKQIAKNTLNIHNIQAVLQGNSQYAEITVSEAYTSRVTANGANIFDNQLTPVESIKGNTVKTKNLIGVIGLQYSGWVSGKTVTSDFEKFLDVFNAAPIGQNFVFSAEVRCDKITNNPFDIRLVGTDNEGNTTAIYMFAVPQTSTFPVNGRVSTIFTKNVDFVDCTVRMSLGNSDTNSNFIKEMQIEYGTVATAYQPYFTGLKNANINSIVSKNTQGETIDTYQLPQTVELAEFDTLYPEKGTIERFTQTKVFEFSQGVWSMPDSGLFLYGGSLDFDVTEPSGQGVCNLFAHNPEQSPIDMTWFLQNGNLYFVNKQISSIADWSAYLAEQSNNGDPLTLAYKATTATTENINAPITYEVDNGGTETINQGETDNSQYGAMPTITQTYLGKVGE